MGVLSALSIYTSKNTNGTIARTNSEFMNNLSVQSVYREIMGDLPNDRILNVFENGVYPQNAGFRGTEFSNAEIPGLLQPMMGKS